MDVFIHVPSSGGTTLWSILKAATGNRAERIRAGGLEHNVRSVRAVLENGDAEGLRILGGHFPVGALDGIDDSARYFTFLRDPTRRFVSSFRRKLRNGKIELGRDPDQRFLQYVRARRTVTIRMLTNLGHETIEAQYESDAFVREVVDRARERFCFVGFTEAFDDSLVQLAETLGWERLPAYDRRNQGGNRIDLGSNTLAQATEMLRSERAVCDALWNDFIERRRDDVIGHMIAKGNLAVRNRVRQMRSNADRRFVKE